MLICSLTRLQKLGWTAGKIFLVCYRRSRQRLEVLLCLQCQRKVDVCVQHVCVCVCTACMCVCVYSMHVCVCVCACMCVFVFPVCPQILPPLTIFDFHRYLISEITGEFFFKTCIYIINWIVIDIVIILLSRLLLDWSLLFLRHPSIAQELTYAHVHISLPIHATHLPVPCVRWYFHASVSHMELPVKYHIMKETSSGSFVKLFNTFLLQILSSLTQETYKTKLMKELLTIYGKISNISVEDCRQVGIFF